MTTLENRPNTALLVIDVQTGVVAAGHDRDAVIANINELVDQARTAGAPVIWVQHNDDEMPFGADGWELAPELSPAEGETIVHKNHRDSFEATTLEDELASRGVGRLIVTGAQTDFCVRWTLHGALGRGYDAILVGDAHTTDDMSAYGMPTAVEIIKHTNTFWGPELAPGRETGTVATSEVSFTATGS